MGLEDKVTGQHAGLTEEQKARILNEVERERRKVLIWQLYSESLNHEDETIHNSAPFGLRALVPITDEKHMQYYEAGLLHKDPTARQNTLVRLRHFLQLRPEPALTLCRKIFDNQFHPETKEWIASELGYLAKENLNEAVSLIENAFADPYNVVREAALDSLPELARNCSDKAIEFFRRVLYADDKDLRRKAVGVLPKLAEALPESAGALYAICMGSPDEEVKKRTEEARKSAGEKKREKPEVMETAHVSVEQIACGTPQQILETASTYSRPDCPEFKTNVEEGLRRIATECPERMYALLRLGLENPTWSINQLITKAADMLVKTRPDEKPRMVDFCKQTFDGLDLALPFQAFQTQFVCEMLAKIQPAMLLEVRKIMMTAEHKEHRGNSSFYPLVALKDSISEDILAPIEDEGYAFLRAYLDSKYVHPGTDITREPRAEEGITEELKQIVQNPDRDHAKLRKIFESGEARDLDEMIECSELSVPNYIVLRRLGLGAIKRAYLARNVLSGDESVLLVIDPTSKGFTHYANIHRELDPDELRERIYMDEFSGAKLRNLEDKRGVALLSPPRECTNGKGEKFYFLETTRYEKTLEEVLEEGKADANTLLRYVHQMALALNNCHQDKIVHKDLKPDNIGITARGNIVLSDFGCTSMFSDSASSRYQYPLVLRPPELAFDEEHWQEKGIRWQSELFTPEANIWTLGAIVYRMFTDRNIFEGPQKRAAPATPEYHEQNRRVYDQIQQFDTIRDKVLDNIKIRNSDAARVVDLCLKTDPVERSDTLTKIVELTKEYA
jgi:tetratricopeptide (TPR) repeat protein